MLGPLCYQTDIRYCFVFVKQKPQEQPQISYEQDILQKHLRVDRSLRPIRDACHDFVILLGVFGHVYASGTQDAVVTKSLAIWHISSVLDQYFVLTLLKLTVALVKS